MKNTDTPSIERLKDEPVARLVYDGMRWAAERAENGQPPPWVQGGNSFAQTEARHIARAIIATLETLPSAGEGVERITSRDTSAREVGRLSSQGRFTVASSASPPEQPDIEGRARELLASKRPYRVFDYYSEIDGVPDQQNFMVSTLSPPQHPVALCGPDRKFADALCAMLNSLSLPATEIRREMNLGPGARAMRRTLDNGFDDEAAFRVGLIEAGLLPNIPAPPPSKETNR